MRDTIINIFKVLIFGLVLAFVIAGLSRLTQRKTSSEKYNDFFTEAKAGHIDVLVVGSSQVDNGFNSIELYRNYGYTAYDLGARGSTIPSTYWILKNALDYCTPKYVLIDCYMADRDYQYLDQMPDEYSDELKDEAIGNFHDAIDAFPFSKNKVAAIRDVISSDDLRKEFYWNFLKYHNRWDELESNDYDDFRGIVNDQQFYGGSCPVYTVNSRASEYSMIPAEQKMEQETISMTYIRRMIELCQSKGVTPILIHMPFAAEEWMQEAANAVYDIADEYGVPYINMLYAGGLINHQEDQCSQTHLTILGAKKVTDYLGNIMLDFGLTDHRGDPAYAAWEQEAARQHSDVLTNVKNAPSLTTEQLASALMLLELDEYNSVIYINHDNSALTDTYVLSELQRLADGSTYLESQSSGRTDIQNHEFGYGESLLIVHDATNSVYQAVTGNSAGTEIKTSFGDLQYLSVNAADHQFWSSLAVSGNESFEDDQKENLLKYYDRSNVNAQIFLFDKESGELVGEVQF